ncbi:hypothetical protein ABZ626_09335 [Streptomyces longispororuber]|uniref:hypothetical protein n=1 Tax=Streptomyces longispororuber TaxID=68230 RepID=UPI0033C100A9
MQTRIVPLAMTTALLAGGTGVLATGAAGAAEPKGDVTAQSCYGSARNYTGTPGGPGRNAHWPATGTYAYATRNCTDINLKVNYTRDVRVCFKNTGQCNGWKKAKKGVWKVAASNVRDGAGFYIQFKGANRSTGKIAY